MNQTYQTMPFDLVHDIQYIDEIISEDATFIHFDKNGTCHSKTATVCTTKYNFFEYQLIDILKEVVPKA